MLGAKLVLCQVWWCMMFFLVRDVWCHSWCCSCALLGQQTFHRYETKTMQMSATLSFWRVLQRTMQALYCVSFSSFLKLSRLLYFDLNRFVGATSVFTHIKSKVSCYCGIFLARQSSMVFFWRRHLVGSFPNHFCLCFQCC